MKILNIHGYKGNAHNSAYTALKVIRSGNDILSPQLDYDSLEPGTILEILHQQIIENGVDTIVGTSLGGFFAAVLSAQLHLPVILVNPCLMPFISLPELGYTREIRPYIALFASLSKVDRENVSCIVGGQDEVIHSHDFTKTLFVNERYEIVPDGKHSGATLPLEDYFRQVLSILANKCRMNVSIYSRKEAEVMIAEGKFPENAAVISFYDPAIKRIDKDYTHVDYSSVCDHVFYSELDDLDLEILKERGYTYDTYFPEADEIAKFVYHAYHSGRDIICQCEYGQSRSAGCAAAILEHFYHTGISIFADYRRYPNQVVYHKVFDALHQHRAVRITDQKGSSNW